MKKIISFISDVLNFKKSPDYVISASSYQIMRFLDNCTAGLSTALIKSWLAPRSFFSNEHLIIELKERGFAKLSGLFALDCFPALEKMPVYCRAKNDLYGDFDSIAQLASNIIGRLEVSEEPFLASSEIATFITSGPFIDIARKHYGREVICVRASSWWSIPSNTNRALDGAAQKYHRDIDWLGELKFFIYGNDVTEENGPLDFILGTHQKRIDRFLFSDGRYDEYQMMRAYSKDKYLESTICKRGEAFVVDTRGYHRGRPLSNGKRLVMCIEFSVNKFGAEFQYLPRLALNPAWDSFKVWQKAIEKNPAWQGLFSSQR
jgi:hypothetical protein